MNKKIVIALLVILVIIMFSIFFIFQNKSSETESTSLNNTTWQITSINNEMIDKQILFIYDQDTIGFQVCNNIGFGNIKVTDKKIYFHSEAMSTKMMCEDELMDLEYQITQLFNKPFDYQITDQEMIMTNRNDKIILKLLSDVPFVPEESVSLGLEEFDLERRQAIANNFPEFPVNYENSGCTNGKGCFVRVANNDNIYYYAYVTSLNSTPVATATCFKIDRDMNVTKTGEFPATKDEKTEFYMDIDPITCQGI
jgi:heat shock protein HslJ